MQTDRGKQVDRCAHCESSDHELESRVRVFLAGLKLPGLRNVSVDVDGGIATVGGTVASFHEKQLATHCCQRVAGVVHVVNDIRVAPPSPRGRSRTRREQSVGA
ncbi:MAG: BON domain-containing protein [Pirellulales bacterium]|nr:BON domain-containing protein [Pirellulales bacterium]